MWDGGLPRKRIAALLGVSYHTVSKWRWQDEWANRRRYGGPAASCWRSSRSWGQWSRRSVRCPVCQGLEVLAAPHQHGAAA
jgi:hypothetical protein